jgi:hypothetical protein
MANRHQRVGNDIRTRLRWKRAYESVHPRLRAVSADSVACRVADLPTGTPNAHSCLVPAHDPLHSAVVQGLEVSRTGTKMAGHSNGSFCKFNRNENVRVGMCCRYVRRCRWSIGIPSLRVGGMGLFLDRSS